MSAVIFDLDGTLIDSGGCGVRATQEAFREFGLPDVSRDEVLANMGIPIEVLFPRLVADACFNFEALYARFREIYAELSSSMIAPFPGVLELIDDLKADGRPLAIVTSKKTSAALSNCRQAGIAIELIVGSDLVCSPKPHPEGVLRALQSLAIAPKDALVVGDAAVDIKMGKQAGTRTCAALWGAHSQESLIQAGPDILIHDPVELLNHLGPEPSQGQNLSSRNSL